MKKELTEEEKIKIRAKKAAYMKEWNKKNSEKIKNWNKKKWQKIKVKDSKRKKDIYKNNREWILNFKESQGCKTCGNKNSLALCFHHKENKKFKIAGYMTISLETLKLEIQKCDILCQNCHLELHHLERLKNEEKYLDKRNSFKYWNNRKFINKYKCNKGCKNCLENRYYCLQFHHLEDKKFAIANGLSKEFCELFKEIKKCEIVCANCHISIHRENAN